MLKIEYSIKIAEDDKYPYIELADNYDDKPEDKFFVLELTKLMLHNLIESKRYYTDPEMNFEMITAFNFIDLLSEEVGKLIVNTMTVPNTISSNDPAIKMACDFEVKTYKDLTGKSIYHAGNATYIKKDGLLAYVSEEKAVYECKENLSNKLEWIKLDLNVKNEL